MGAGAFLIAEYTRTPYVEIVTLSILPALMYFATVLGRNRLAGRQVSSLRERQAA